MNNPRRLIPRPALRHRYGVSRMTIYRWRHDPAMAFPEPDLVVGDREYFAEDKLERWEQERVRAARDRRAAAPQSESCEA